ncbi:MAG: SDR family oxidoreductase [Deltaproteobacteria bacterium]|nr:MAG: SDR family oxidoreductase [Deltaproteobacteria bacterium]
MPEPMLQIRTVPGNGAAIVASIGSCRPLSSPEHLAGSGSPLLAISQRTTTSSLQCAIPARRPPAVLAARVKEPIDVLVNNAGVYTGSPRDIWAVNVRGPLLLTRALAGKLAKGARVVMVTSGLGGLSNQAEPLRHKLQDPQLTIEDILALCERPPGGYGPSKAALNALTRLFAGELPNARVNAACPGWVRTDMGGPGAPRSVEQGAASVLWACRLAADGPTGGTLQR